MRQLCFAVIAAVLLLLCFSDKVQAQDRDPPDECRNTSGTFTTGNASQVNRDLNYAKRPLLLYVEPEVVTVHGFYTGERPSSKMAGCIDYDFKAVDVVCEYSRRAIITFVKSRFKDKAVKWAP